MSNTTEAATGSPDPTTARSWAKILSKYRDPSNPRGIFEITVTVLPFVGLWALTAVLVTHGYWLGLLLCLPAAMFLVRLFMIQHDCGHGSFVKNSTANNWIGRILGVLTFTPYSSWQRNHALHHAGSGCLDHRGFGEIVTITVDEYKRKSAWERAKYRAYRHPLVMFGIGPTYLFLLDHRLPIGMMRRGW